MSKLLSVTDLPPADALVPFLARDGATTAVAAVLTAEAASSSCSPPNFLKDPKMDEGLLPIFFKTFGLLFSMPGLSFCPVLVSLIGEAGRDEKLFFVFRRSDFEEDVESDGAPSLIDERGVNEACRRKLDLEGLREAVGLRDMALVAFGGSG